MTDNNNQDGSQGGENNQADQKNDQWQGIQRSDYDEAVRKSRLYYGQVADMEKKLESLGGIDGIQSKLQKLDELERKTAKSGNDKDLEEWQKNKEAEIRQTIQDEINDYKKKYTETSSQLHKIQVVDKVADNWQGKFLNSAMPLIKDQYINKYVDKDENGEFIIKDDNDEIRYNGALKMTLEDYFNEIASKHEDLLAGQRASGTHPRGTTNTKSKPALPDIDVSGLSYAEAVKAHAERARALMASDK